MSEKYIKIENLSVSEVLYNFINEEAIPQSNINKKDFWQGFNEAVHELTPKNRELLKKRERIQIEIDRWHLDNKNEKFDENEYKNFLKKIGYLKDEGPDCKIETKNVDDEIAK